MAGWNGMDGYLVGQLQAFIAAAQGAGHSITLTSGHRDPAKQQALWAAALDKYGDPEVADNWVARPGTSNHERGMAGDLGFGNRAAREWAHANAAAFGLHFPMSWEPWHIELSGQAGRSPRGAYTTPPPGHAHPHDGPNPYDEDPHDPGVQMRRAIAIFNGAGSMAGVEGMASPMMASPSTEMEAIAAAMVTGDQVQAMGAPPENPNADPNAVPEPTEEVA
jgi:hypothetical protein